MHRRIHTKGCLVDLPEREGENDLHCVSLYTSPVDLADVHNPKMATSVSLTIIPYDNMRKHTRIQDPIDGMSAGLAQLRVDTIFTYHGTNDSDHIRNHVLKRGCQHAQNTRHYDILSHLEDRRQNRVRGTEWTERTRFRREGSRLIMKSAPARCAKPGARILHR